MPDLTLSQVFRAGLILALLELLAGNGHVSGQPPHRCRPVTFFPGAQVLGSGESPLVITSRGHLCRKGLGNGEKRGAEIQVAPTPTSPGKAFLYSAVIPGSGQRLLGQGRWPPYLAVEIWSWVQFFLRRSHGDDLRRRYRDLAWEVARRVSVGARRDGDFGYYESLTQFRSSGAFDGDPLQRGIQPETDPATFNGSVWQLAQDIFFPPDAQEPPVPGSPAYERALEYYLDRSVSPRFAWDWADNSLQRSVFDELIKESDRAFRSSTDMIGVILANHFVSAIDALISARLADTGRDPERVSLKALPLVPGGPWGVSVRIRSP